MMNRKSVCLILVCLMALMPVLAMTACATAPAATAPATSSTPAPSASPADSPAGTDASEPPAADPSLQKYDPPITVSTIKLLDDGVKFVEGEDINNNVWSKAYQEKLGIALTYDWTASTQQQYDDKLNVNIASGDLPDLFKVSKSQLARLVKTDLVNKDLGAVYEQYGSALLKNVMTLDGTLALDSGSFGGKLAALPLTGGSFDAAPMMYIRQDWLDGLGKEAPATIDELLALIDDFTTKDPDKSGATNYYGIAMCKDLYNEFGGINGICNAFHAYPQMWVKDAGGKLVYGSYRPEMKAVLKLLQDLYAAGKIDPEFAVKDRDKENELISSGRIGIEFGVFWNPVLLQTCIDNNPNADWTAYPLPSVDGEPARAGVRLGVYAYYMCSSDFQYPEAMVKMDNLFLELGYGSDPGNFSIYLNNTIDGTAYEFFHYAAVITWPPAPYERVPDALRSKDPSQLNAEDRHNYDQAVAFEAGDRSAWALARVFGIDGSYSTEGKYKSSGHFMMNEFYGSDTNTMTLKQTALDKLELETFTKIIMGEPIDSFDTFVTTVMSLGGSDIEKEVNDWYASTK